MPGKFKNMMSTFDGDAFKKYIRMIGHILAIISIIFLAKILINSFEEIKNFKIDFNSLLILTIGVFTGVLGALAQSYSWTIQLKKKYPEFKLHESFRIIGITQIGKYLPGNVAHFVGRAYLASKKIDNADIVFSLFVENVLLVAAGLILGLVYFLYIDMNKFVSLNSYLILLLLSIPGFFIGFYVLNKLKQRFNLLTINFLSLIKILIIFMLMLTGGGFVIYILFYLTSEPGAVSLLLCISSFALSFLVGFMIPGAPGGIGVREYAFVLLLSPFTDKAIALQAILFFRLINVAGDLLLFSMAKGLLKPEVD